jgi:hypothetical protein
MTARNTGKRDWCKASLPQALTEAESPVVKARFTELIEYLRIEHEASTAEKSAAACRSGARLFDVSREAG